MTILAIDTTGSPVSCALGHDDLLFGEIYYDITQKHSVTLMPSVETLLKLTDLQVRDLDALAVVRGPGSFTGVRIGIATISGMALGLEKPIYSVSTLDALLSSVPPGMPACALLDARRSEVYVKAEAAGRTVIPENALPLAEVLKAVRAFPGMLFTGDGSIRYRQQILEVLPDARFAPPVLAPCRASFAFAAISKGLYEEHTYATLQAVYIRPSQAERLRREKE